MMEVLVKFLLTGSLIQVEALKGSCVFIPCTFDINQQLKNYLTDSAKRMWFKDGRSTAVFDSSRPNNGLLKGEIFGTATEKNCTTRFDNVDQSHDGSYYFRLEANGVLKYNYKEPTHSQIQITVLGEFLEGRSVTLSCSSDANPAVNYTWYRDTERPLNPVQTGSNLTINNTGPTHSGRYYCTAENKHGTQNSSVLLDVQYAPKNTSVRINPAGLVLEGRSVTLICSSDANPAVNYTWYRDTERPLNPVQTGPNLTINNTGPTHSGRYYCTAENKHGTQNTSVLLDVQSFTSSSVMEGDPVTLSCSTDANPAELNYTWYTETGSQFELLQTGHNHTYIVTNPTYGARYGCKAQNQHGQCNATIQLDVQCEYKDKPQINLI
uniref:B-cell receptor CD22-like n=1 Tax=Sinocyclocheilus anshuiensis TaxID=1608454 RepID=A0A671RUA0_9TELE